MKMKTKQPYFRDDFLHTIATIFNAARWFGIPSQRGMTTICVSFIILLMLLALEVTAIWKLVRAFGGWSVTKGSVIARLSGAIFYGNALFSQILTWKFITSWQELTHHWIRAETSLVPLFKLDYTIKKKMIILTSIVSICAILEHTLSMMAATGFDCPPAEYFERYILVSHGFLLHSYDYRLLFAVPIFLLSKLATIMWNFQDLIIILVSMGLSSRYYRLNSITYSVIITGKSINYNQTKRFEVKSYSQVQTWRRLRQAYVRQAALVRRVGDKLGALILLSNFNNLYFICLQLFLGINNEQGPPINRIYYLFSLAWLLSRACGVVLAAADIRVHSQSILPLLQTACHSNFDVEVKRLKTQLKYDYVALQGMGLFSLDRKLLMNVAAAILKYELILIQFDK